MATATRVQFYHNTPDPLAFACEMVARAWGSGRKVAVRLADGDSVRRLDHLLWTADPLAFVPHVAVDSPLAAETPVVLAAAGKGRPWPHADLLFNLADDLPPGFEAFRLVVEVVGQSETARQPARARWMHYKRRGLALQAFDAERRTAL